MTTTSDIITNALMYKQSNPPKYRIVNMNNIYCLGTVLSKAITIIINVYGKGKISQHFVYDINNKIVKYRCSYYSEEQRKKDMKQNRKKSQVIKRVI